MAIVDFKVAKQLPAQRAEPALGRDFDDSPMSRAGGLFNGPQFLRHMDKLAARQSEAYFAELIGSIRQGEIEALINHAARIKARYLVTLLELEKLRTEPSAALIDELRSLRLKYEEMEQGLDLIKRALTDGQLAIEGVQRPA